jgi:hypothetical protein
MAWHFAGTELQFVAAIGFDVSSSSVEPGSVGAHAVSPNRIRIANRIGRG